jgi:hypothetical protein
MITPKEYIADLIQESIKVAQKLNNDLLKEKVEGLLRRLLDFIDDESKLVQVLDMSRKLSISTMEAIDFQDYEELTRVTVIVHQDIENIE